MKPNDGRESAHVRSRVIDKSNVQASTEYLPLFTCLAPKGDSIEPVLIRHVDDLLNEFGDPSINPTLYCDLISIRDFVRGGRSCWVNRVPVNAQKFHYYFYLNNTLPLVYNLYFTYPQWDSLTTEERSLVNAGYINGGYSEVRFRDHHGNTLDVDIYTDILDVLSRKDEIYTKTGWVVEIPDNPLVNIAKKHNSIQQFTSATDQGRKYITMRWQGTYSTPEKHILTSTVYVQPVDSDGKIIRDSDGHLIRPIDYISHFKQTVVPVKVLEDVIDAYIGIPDELPLEIEPNTTKFLLQLTNTILFKSRTIQVIKPTNTQTITLYIEPDPSSTTVANLGKNEIDFLNTVEGSNSTNTRITHNQLFTIIDDYYKDILELVESDGYVGVRIKADYPQDYITTTDLSVVINKFSYTNTPNIQYYPDPSNPSSRYIEKEGAIYKGDFPELALEDGVTVTFSIHTDSHTNSIIIYASTKCMWYYEGPTSITVPDIPIYELMNIRRDFSKQYSLIDPEEKYAQLTLPDSGSVLSVRNNTEETITLQDISVKISVANSSGTGDVYQEIKLPAGTYNQLDARYITDKLIHVFYKSTRYTESKLRKRKVYSRIPMTNEEWEDYLVPESELIDGTEYYTNEKDSTSIERTEPNWQTFIYSSSSPNIPKAPLYRLYYTSTSPSIYYYNAAFEVCDSNYSLIYSVGASLIYVDDHIINSLVKRTLYRGEEAEYFSVYFPYSYWSEIEDYLKDNFDIEMHYPDGFSSRETHLTSFDTTLIPELSSEDPLLFNMDSMLYQDSNILTITSVTKLKPESAGVRIHYVIQGYDISFADILVEETITLPDHFTDGQFAEAMNANPYINLTVENPESENIYKSLIGGYTSNLDYTVLYDLNWAVTLDDYQRSIKQYEDPKYFGSFIADLTYPLVRYVEDPEGYAYYETYVMDEDSRRAVHWTMKEIAATREDLTCIFTTPNLSLDQACNWVSSKGDYSGYWEYGNKLALDYSDQAFYCEMYYGWFSYRTSLVNGQPYKIKEVGPCIFVLANIIDTWKTRGIVSPVAGDQGGVLNSNIDYINILDNPDSKSKRDKLVSNRINPIWDTGLRGIQIYGNETLNPLYTDLSAAHIARMLVRIRYMVDTYTETIKFSLNNQYTWGGWINYVSSQILEPLKATGGLIWYSVDMGKNTTTQQELANRRVNGKIGLQFKPDLEIIDLEYTVYSSSLDVVEITSTLSV